jgi:predicted SAM-dependent methyltransferase
MLARINLGSDVFKIPGLVNVDIRPGVRPDVVMDIKNLGFPDKIASEIHMGNILEHISSADVPVSLSECKRVLVDTGTLYITVPLVDVAEECFRNSEISVEALRHIIYGEDEGYNSHKAEYRRGDLERILLQNGFRTEPLDLRTFPYLVVSNYLDPKPDPWQYGVKAFKI